MGEKTGYADLPNMECPACGETFQCDDYYGIGSGSEETCPHCGANVVVLDIETTTSVRTGLKAPPEWKEMLSRNNL